MKTLHLLLCVAVAAVSFACDRNTTFVEEVAGPTPCVQCHDTTNLITGKHAQWAESVHGTGEAYLRGTSADCVACHSGGGFVKAVAAGQNPGQTTEGDPEPTRQDCRTCHRIHTTYTSADWGLRTTKPVTLYAVANAMFDGGEGNLCVNCHQPRRDFPVAVNDSISGISSHWGPHHGPQSAMILGRAGSLVGTPHQHYGVENTCVHCHLGDEQNHTFEPNVAACKLPQCHPTATDFDIDGVQTEIANLADLVGAELLNRGLINENSPDGHPTVTKAQQGEATALYDWLYVAHEDKSMGVHNPPYARALMTAALDSLGVPVPAPLASRARSGNGGSK